MSTLVPSFAFPGSNSNLARACGVESEGDSTSLTAGGVASVVRRGSGRDGASFCNGEDEAMIVDDCNL
jgi:hypothetical protein